MKNTVFAGLISIAFILPGVSFADSNWYVGAGVGVFQNDIRDNAIPINGSPSSTLNKDDIGASYKLFAGYQITPSIAIEGGLIDLSKVSATRTLSNGNGSAKGALRVYGLNLDLIGTMPINDSFAVLGRLGVLTSRAKDSRSTTGTIFLVGNPDITKTTTQLDYGLGLQYNLNTQWKIRGEWEHTKVSWFNNGKPDINLLGINAIFQF